MFGSEKKSNLSQIAAPSILLICLVIGSILRLDHIALRPFWLDEANAANLLHVASWSKISAAESCPIYVIISDGWSGFWGDSERSLRMLSAIFSLGSIIAAYPLGKELFGRKAGLWSAFLMAVNYFSIFYAIQARQYSFIIFVSLLSGLALLKLSRRRSLINIFSYILINVISAYSHPWMFLLIGAHLVWVALFERKLLRILLPSLLVVLSAAIPYLISLLRFAGNGINDWISIPSLSAIGETFDYFTYGSGWLFVITGSIGAFLLIFKIRKKEQSQNISYSIEEDVSQLKQDLPGLAFSLCCLLLPILTGWLISQFIPLYVPGRYEAVALPGFILLAAFLLSRFRNPVFISLLALILFFSSYAQVRAEKQAILSETVNDRTVAEAVISAAANGDLVIFTDLSGPSFQYYSSRIGSTKRIRQEYFPAEMAAHPAAQRSYVSVEDKRMLSAEAQELASKIAQEKTERDFSVWVLSMDSNPASQTLSAELAKSLTLEESDKLYGSRLFPDGPEAVAPLHLQEVLRFR